ncbi:MAG TPA: fluoride efflux transporter CrcB [Acidimicrobiia bacterium]|nr:fluoride efflux transporter CrcB [Acidimicrobiia bacterium]
MIALGVALGGGLGALARYHLTGWIAPRQETPYPTATLVVNVAGSFLLGLTVAAAADGEISSRMLAWTGAGFLGGFTTFSTFAYETARLIEDGAWRYALANLALAGPLSFAAAAVGYLLVR